MSRKTARGARSKSSKKWLRIGELVRRAGVSKATIHHYLQQGLLPPPRKTGRTMAYYDPSSVDRVLLIKELQQRYLPLGAIRQLLSPPGERETGAVAAADVAALVQASREVRALLEPAERPLARHEIDAETGIDPVTLAGLERIELVAPKREEGRELFGPSDVAVLRAVGKLGRAGINRDAGFREENLLFYLEAMRALVLKEVALFTGQVVGRAAPANLVALATAAATGATDLVAALHRKLVADFVASVMPD